MSDFARAATGLGGLRARAHWQVGLPVSVATPASLLEVRGRVGCPNTQEPVEPLPLAGQEPGA
jgi:hypothetical protein